MKKLRILLAYSLAIALVAFAGFYYGYKNIRPVELEGFSLMKAEIYNPNISAVEKHSLELSVVSSETCWMRYVYSSVFTEKPTAEWVDPKILEYITSKYKLSNLVPVVSDDEYSVKITCTRLENDQEYFE